MRELSINGRRIADDEPAWICAEIGNNHGGDLGIAFDMIDAAAQAGADAVKFQRRTNQTLYSRELLDTPYDNPHSFGSTYGAHRAALELPASAYPALAVRASRQGLACFATAFDEQSADELEEWLDPPAYKLASGSLTDHALLAHVAKLGKPIILSTGGGTIEQVDEALAIILAHNTQIALLHCCAAYPAEFSELNLYAITTMRIRYGDIIIGWSCHVHNLSMIMAAYALGARIVEVHTTLNRSMKGTDHAFSMEPATLKKLRKDLDRVKVALGDGVKRIYPSEIGPISKMRRVPTAHGLQITGDTSWASPLTASSPQP